MRGLGSYLYIKHWQRIFRGAKWSVAVKILGGWTSSSNSERKDPQHIDLAQSFAIMSEASEEILIQCQARSREANLMFQFAALTLMRVQ